MNQKILNKIREFTKARNWEQFHTGENLAKSLIIEAAELLNSTNGITRRISFRNERGTCGCDDLCDYAC